MPASCLTPHSAAVGSGNRGSVGPDTNFSALRLSSRGSRDGLHLLSACGAPQRRGSRTDRATTRASSDSGAHNSASQPCELSSGAFDLHSMGMCEQLDSCFGTDLGLPIWNPDNWQFGALLGSGSFGAVYRAIELSSGRSWAVKALSKSPPLGRRPSRGTGRISRRKLLARLRREIDTLQQLDGCESAIGFEGAFESETHAYLVMEVVDNGDLSDVFRARGPLPERQAAMLVYEVLRVVRCCHSAGILHGDIKPSNFLLMSDNPLSTAAQLSAPGAAAAPAAVYDSLTGAHMAQSAAAAPTPAPAESSEPYEGGWLKGVDFGCSNEAPPGALLCKMTGTPAFMAPEVFSRAFSLPADMWSMGMLAYQAIANRLPYWHNETEMHSSTMVDVRAAVSEEPIPLDYGPWLNISAAGRHLITALLTHDPLQRLSAEEAALHPWFVEQGLLTAAAAAASSCAAAGCHVDLEYSNVLPCTMHRSGSGDSLCSVAEVAADSR